MPTKIGAWVTGAILSITCALTPAAAETAQGPHPAPPQAQTQTRTQPGTVDWRPCPKRDPVAAGRLRGLECGTLEVPLDHDRPAGEKITLALSRARHTTARSAGIVLLNRGGPGGGGRDLPAMFTRGLPRRVVERYDWIGFDPRGVGASRPAIVCDESYQDPGRPRPDTVPESAAAEHAWRAAAAAFAADCGRRYPRLLPHMGTVDSARDMDAVRRALGRQRLNYFGYSYGSYLGAVYATLYPGRVRRMVLDGIVRPSRVWYRMNLDQNRAFERRIRNYFGWIARHHATYGLGRTRAAVARRYAAARAVLKLRPADGRMGAVELDDLFLQDGYGSTTWPAHAAALADLALRDDDRALRRLWKPPTREDQNGYAVYAAVECRDAPWPRDWARWHRDHWALYRAGNRFETWSNAWYNAPCAFWPVPGGPAQRIGTVGGGPSLLLVQSTDDAATPYPGAVEVHKAFPRSRLVVQRGGDHGLTLRDRCVDRHVAGYLLDGTSPAARPGPDAVCPAAAEPVPAPAA